MNGEDDDRLYNPDNYGCRRRAVLLFLAPIAALVGLCSLGGCLL